MKTGLGSTGAALARHLCTDVASHVTPTKWRGTWDYRLSMNGMLMRESGAGPNLAPSPIVQLPGCYDEGAEEEGAEGDAVQLNVRLEPAMHISAFGGLLRRVLVISNIHVHDQWCGRGLFSGFLDVLEEWLRSEAAGCSALYVQNICDPRLPKFLAGRGWSEAEGEESRVECMVLVAPTAPAVL